MVKSSNFDFSKPQKNMSINEKIKNFDPNGPGQRNEHFIGLPFEEEDAELVLVSIPWDVTTSYREGTASGPENILESSYQLDLLDPHVADAWELGIFMRPPNPYWKRRNEELRPKAASYIEFLESGGDVETDKKMLKIREEINQSGNNLNNWVKEQTSALLKKDKLVGLVGGEHSIPLGFLEALAAIYPNFGILQIDAHMDLRKAYEGLNFSHASIFHNALNINNISALTQVGIRDYCEEELILADQDERVTVFFDYQLKEKRFQGMSFHDQCIEIINTLPQQVYISFDIDGLAPSLCPNTGTPVPGGFSFQEANYLLYLLVQSGREIIGFDLCEVAGVPNEWDGNVGARMLYKLCNLTGRSKGRI